MSDRAKGFLKEDHGGFLVGAENKKHSYKGPVAEVYSDEKWLHIITDSYDGAAMLNIEALPYLQKALRKIAKRLKDAKQ